MRTLVTPFVMLAAVASTMAAGEPLVTVNVVVPTNTTIVVDAKAAAEADAAAKKAAEKAARAAAKKRAAQAAAARARSAVVIKQLIADLKTVPGKGYLLGRTEVTAEQWHAVMTPDVPFVGEGSLPASGISWDDSEDFIKRLNERNETIAEGLTFRLPTVKEWRYVCLAGGKGKWGKVPAGAVGHPDNLAWHAGNSGAAKSAVAQKSPNAWGLYDMHGSVFEWCSDVSPDYGGDFRLRVGGSFRTPLEQCSAWFSNSANRTFSRYDDQGLRVLAEHR